VLLDVLLQGITTTGNSSSRQDSDLSETSGDEVLKISGTFQSSAEKSLCVRGLQEYCLCSIRSSSGRRGLSGSAASTAAAAAPPVVADAVVRAILQVLSRKQRSNNAAAAIVLLRLHEAIAQEPSMVHKYSLVILYRLLLNLRPTGVNSAAGAQVQMCAFNISRYRF
jgi:hypothetical protein